MLGSATRWFMIAAPAVAGVVLLIFGTAGATSVAFGVTLIGLAPIIWMWNWFIRMSFDDHDRDKETSAREQRAREQRERMQRSKRPPLPPHPTSKLGRPRRRPL